MKNVVIDIETIDRLKREAKKIKKEIGYTHTECLEIVAQKYGWPTWHAVTLSCQPYREAISHWENGIVVMFDMPDTDCMCGDYLARNDLVFDLAVPTMMNNVSEAGLVSEEEFAEILEGYMPLSFALTNCTIPKDIDVDWLHRKLKHEVFHMPLAVFWRTEPVFDASLILCSKEYQGPFMCSW